LGSVTGVSSSTAPAVVTGAESVVSDPATGLGSEVSGIAVADGVSVSESVSAVCGPLGVEVHAAAPMATASTNPASLR